MAKYCTVNDVKLILPANITIRIDDANELIKPVEDTTIESYIDLASSTIDGAISVLYTTPLVQIVTVNKSDMSEVIAYPHPIPYCCSLLAAYLIYEKLFGEEMSPDKIPQYAQEYKTQAYKVLNDIRSGALLLKGQKQTGWRYLRPESKNTNRLPVEFKEFDTSKM